MTDDGTQKDYEGPIPPMTPTLPAKRRFLLLYHPHYIALASLGESQEALEKIGVDLVALPADLDRTCILDLDNFTKINLG